jgi:hypothetical protein
VHPTAAPFQKGNVLSWIEACTRAGNRRKQKEMAGIILYFWRILWKERNTRVFEQKECSFNQMVQLTSEAIRNFYRAAQAFSSVDDDQ